MKRVIHFEIGADSPERAIKFYKEVFDWKIEKWDAPIDYWLTTSGRDDERGIDGAIKHREGPQQAVINTIDVPSVDEFIHKIKNAGGEVVMPKTEIPGIGFNAYCKDTEGNIFGLFEGGPSDK